MKRLSLTASKWGKDLFWNAFIFHSQGKLAFEAENQLPQNGGSISFKVKSYYSKLGLVALDALWP